MTRSTVHNLCFHGIGPPRRAMEPGEERYWVTTDDFHGILDEVAALPSVRISFDDGNSSDVDIALAALHERGLSATFFVLAGRLGTVGSLDAEEVRELNAHGMGVGTHGWAHRPWRHLTPADRHRELVEARERIAEVLGAPVDEAALPLGEYDRSLLSELRRLGYAAVYTSDRRPATDGAWLQPRFSVLAGESPRAFLDRALADPTLTRRAGDAVKGLVKRLR